MVAKAKQLELTPTASFFLSLSEELASASRTYNPRPDFSKGELIKYPNVSLNKLSTAIRLCFLTEHHIYMAAVKPRGYEISAPCLREVFNRLGKPSCEILSLLELMEEQISILTKIRFLLCSRKDISDASFFCYLMHTYFYQIESESEIMGSPARATIERALS